MQKYIIIIILFIFLSCVGESKNKFVKDDGFFNPEHRVNKIIGNDTFYFLHRRYFVYNYASNKKHFINNSAQLICKSLNDSLLISRCNFSFLEMPWYSGKHDEDFPPAPSFLDRICHISWDLSQPNKLEVKYENLSDWTTKTINFDCDLDEEYPNY